MATECAARARVQRCPALLVVAPRVPIGVRPFAVLSIAPNHLERATAHLARRALDCVFFFLGALHLSIVVCTLTDTHTLLYKDNTPTSQTG